MKASKLLAAAAVAIGLCSFGAHAQDDDAFWQSLSPDAQAALRDRWEAMPPEEQQEWIQQQKQRKAAFEALSPAEQARIKNRREERRQEWAAMSEDERRASIADFRQQMTEVQARWDSMSGHSPGHGQTIRQVFLRYKPGHMRAAIFSQLLA